MKKLCYVATIPAVVHAFLRVHIQAAAESYHVTVVCSAVDKHLLDGINAHFIFLHIERKPSFLRDMQLLLHLYSLFRRERFDVVHSFMPKTGVVAMLAAWLVGVRIRIHTFTGQVWTTKQGAQRVFLKWLDKLIGMFATCILTDSTSQLDFLLKERVLQPDKANVIGSGSICGVDPLRFYPDAGIKHEVRDDLGIAHDAKVILFVGRLSHDKGSLDLAEAFNEIAKRNLSVVLLLVGAEEDVSFLRIREICYAGLDRLHYVGFTLVPERYMMAADIFCLPSYREGFGMAIIEAAACAIPTVASRIYGITDAVVDGKTGLLFAAGDVSGLSQNLLKLIMEDKLRLQLGIDARLRALQLFSSKEIAREMMMLYDRLSKENDCKNVKSSS